MPLRRESASRGVSVAWRVAGRRRLRRAEQAPTGRPRAPAGARRRGTSACSTSGARAGTWHGHSSSAAARSSGSSAIRKRRERRASGVRGRARRRRRDDGAAVRARILRRRPVRRSHRAPARPGRASSRGCGRLCATRGRLVLTTPNVANWAMRLSLLGGRWRYTERGILDRTHVHLFTRTTLVETLERAGYRVIELDFTVPVPRRSARRPSSDSHTPSGALRPRFSPTSSSSPPSQRDLDRHPCEGRRRRPRPLPRGDLAPANRRGGRGRRRRLGLPRRKRRAGRGIRRSRPLDPAERVPPRTHAQPRSTARTGRHRWSSRARTPTRRPSRGSPISPLGFVTRRGSRACTGGSCRTHDAPPAREVLPRLPLRPRATKCSDSRRASELSFEVTLFSNVNSAIPRRVWEAYPFADDIVMSEDQEWSRRVLRAGCRSRLRARRGCPSLARVLRDRRDAALLRLWCLGGAIVRRRARVELQVGPVEGGGQVRAG